MYGWILIVLIAVFLLQNILQLFFGMDGLLRERAVRAGGFLPDWLALSESNFAEFKIWTLFSYSLFHGSLFHLLANALVIFFVGRMVEMQAGGESVLKLFILAAVGGGLFWTIVNWGLTGGVLIGASGGALGILIYFCLRNPNQPITLLLFFVIPVTVLPKWIGWGLLALETFGLVFTELSARGEFFPESQGLGIAHSAHLGGMAAGFLFFRYESWFRKLSIPKIRIGNSSSKGAVKPRYRVNVSKTASSPAVKSKKADKKGGNLREEVDRILDKINTSGFGSLTEQEKETLNQAKELLGK